MKRNYLPIGRDPKFDIYHNTISRLMVQSEILNGAGQTPNVYSTIFDSRGIKTELYYLIGDEKGRVLKDGLPLVAIVPYLKGKLQEVEEKFERFCKRQVAQGLSKPKDWPSHLLKERLILEAKLLVRQEEAQELQRRLKIISDKEKEVTYTKVLRDGPIGNGTLRDGELALIDGMNVQVNEDKILFIDCSHPKAEAFDGYSVADYRNYIVQPWKLACSKQSEINKKKAKVDGVKYELLSRGLRQGTNAPVPTFPDGCINFKKQVLERTK